MSPSPLQNHSAASPLKPNAQPEESQLGKAVAKISDRVDGLEIKIVSITNIVKLLQKYTETKDEQYEK